MAAVVVLAKEAATRRRRELKFESRMREAGQLQSAGGEVEIPRDAVLEQARERTKVEDGLGESVARIDVGFRGIAADQRRWRELFPDRCHESAQRCQLPWAKEFVAHDHWSGATPP